MEARENKTDELFSSVSLHLSLMSLVSPLLSTLFFNFSVSHVSRFPLFASTFLFSHKPPPPAKANPENERSLACEQTFLRWKKRK